MNGNLYEERGEDRRIRKSKKALQEALIRLLSNIWRTTARLPRCWQASTVHRG